MFSDEKMLLELRLNTLDSFVDKFIIAEASYFHNGDKKKLNFNINDYGKFRDKIDYIVIKDQPPGILEIKKNDNQNQIDEKKILNSISRDNFQREQLNKRLNNLEEDDLIIISDLDEIPDLRKIDLNSVKDEILIFKQKMFYYKFNLCHENFIWHGSKIIKKKHFISPQWLRNIKNKKYSFWRFDTYFSKKKYNNIKFIEKGGWHFTCIKKAEEIHKKLLTFAHHQDYENSKISLTDLKKRIEEKRILYDHEKDKKNQNKWHTDKILKKINTNLLPDFVINNLDKYKNWID